MSYNKLGFTSGQTLKAEHLNHMEDGIANAGGVTSWNDLTDKPFGSEVTEGVLKWDGDSSGKEVLDLVNNHQNTLAKVSNDTFTADELNGCTMVIYTKGMGETEITIGQENAQAAQFVEGLVAVMLEQTPFVLTVVDDDVYAGMPMKKGTYFNVTVDEAEVVEYVKSISCLTHKVETIKTLDEKYLPELTSPSGKKFKLSVDDNGTISATEV